MSFLLAVVPLLVLVAALLCGRYPGADLLDRLRTERRPRLPFASPPPMSSARPAEPLLPRGAALIAFSLAGRAPPASGVA